MSTNDVQQTRRTVLKTVGGTAVGLTVTVGAAAAGHEHPDVDTTGGSSTEPNTATFSGEVTAFGDGADSVDAWFQYDKASSNDFDFATSKQTLSSPDSFLETVDTLTAGETYKFRAVAEDNDDGDRGYGDTDEVTVEDDDDTTL